MGQLAVLGGGRNRGVDCVWERWASKWSTAAMWSGEGEAARAQLIQAMHITSAKLHQIHKRVQGNL